MSKIKVKQTRSMIGVSKDLEKIVKSLGLKGIGSEKLHKDNNCIRGMVNKVIHLIDYELVSE